jgi:hypothetical protein
MAHRNSLGFLKDILPILISSVALFVSVLTPYLLIRYEKIYALNKENKEFLRQVEIYLLEWLNVTSHNARLNEEFLGVLETVAAIFPKTFQFYDFPTMDFFKSYNVELVNEFYVQTRKLKDFNHHLRMIDKEYSTFKNTIMSGGKLADNSGDFFKEAVGSLKKQYPKAIEDMAELRIIVRLLLKQANNVDALQVNKFFSLGQQSRFWYKRDIKFTQKEIDNEKAALKKEQDGVLKET